MDKRRHHYRIANPFRFFIFIVISMMIVIFAAYSITGISDAQAATVNSYAQVTIQEGDNLWALVEKYNPDANIDIRSAIYDIYEVNDIDANSVQPGMTIFVPVY